MLSTVNALYNEPFYMIKLKKNCFSLTPQREVLLKQKTVASPDWVIKNKFRDVLLSLNKP